MAINWGALFQGTMEHLFLIYLSLFVSIGVAVPMAIIALRSKKFAKVTNIIANFIQAIPSFAVVAIAVPLIGIGFMPAIFAITLRILLPIYKNTYTGLSNVEKTQLDYAKAIGLTKKQILWKVRVPNAMPGFFSGVKFSAVLANSIAILTAVIDSGGLGGFVFRGLASYDINKILMGAIPTIIIAVLMELLIIALEKEYVPRNLRNERSDS